MTNIVDGMIKAFPATLYRRLTRSVIIAAASLLAAGACWAADDSPTGFYLRVGGGLSEAMDAKVHDTVAATQLLDGNQTGSVPGMLHKVIGSPLVSVGAGYGLNQSLQLGGTFGYHTGFNLHDHDQHFAAGMGNDATDFGSVTEFDGQIKVRSYTGDVTYRIPAAAGSLRPYVSGGAGLASVTTDRATFHYNGTATNFMGQSTNNRTYHFGAGVSVAFSKKATLDVGYQYSDFGNVKYPMQTFLGNNGPQVSGGFTGRLKSNDFIASLVFFFR